MTGIYSQIVARNLPAIHKHGESMKTEMLKFVGICIDAAEKDFVVYHGE
jgi:hypothetical protein